MFWNVFALFLSFYGVWLISFVERRLALIRSLDIFSESQQPRYVFILNVKSLYEISQTSCNCFGDRMI